MRLFRCSPLWAVNKVAHNFCRSAGWKPLLLPAMLWFGIYGGTSNGVQQIRDAAMRLNRSTTSPASFPRLAMSRKGEAFALWCEGVYGSQTLWGNRYDPGAGWGAPQHLGTREGDETEARAALNSQGGATLLWMQGGGRVRHLLAASYHPWRGWGTPVVLDSTGRALSPQVLHDDEGNSLAFWHRYEPAENCYHFISARCTSAGWGSPCVIGKDQLVPAGAVSGNGSGRAAALWSAAGGGSREGEMRHNTWVRLFDPREGWRPAVPLGREIVQDGYPEDSLAQTVPGHHAPLLAMNGAGKLLAVWQEVTAPGRNYQLKAALMGHEEGWGPPEQIGENPLGVSAALSDSGVALVAFTQASNWPDLDAYLSSLTVATDVGLGWISEKVLDNYPYFCLSPSVVIGKKDQPLVTWVKGSGESKELWAATRSLSGWTSTIRLDTEGSVDQYEAGHDGGGNAMVVWTQRGGSGCSVWGRTVHVEEG